MLVPSMPLAAARTSSKLRQNLTPPDLPRPPAWICALTIHWEPPSALAASTAASGELATLPGGTAMPYCANSSLAWYSWKFIRYLERTEKHGGRTRARCVGHEGRKAGLTTCQANWRNPHDSARYFRGRGLRWKGPRAAAGFRGHRAAPAHPEIRGQSGLQDAASPAP